MVKCTEYIKKSNGECKECKKCCMVPPEPDGNNSVGGGATDNKSSKVKSERALQSASKKSTVTFKLNELLSKMNIEDDDIVNIRIRTKRNEELIFINGKNGLRNVKNGIFVELSNDTISAYRKRARSRILRKDKRSLHRS
ncbi:MAG: hypothetical protein Q4B70_18285, partial [Lachnospiraceae bacterium]|nr:hypothetical protein [Lachnospiraceae bacterium]